LKKGTRVLTIEWRHLDVGGETCVRCSGTYANIVEALRSLDRSGDLKGISVTIVDTPLPEERIGESNLVLMDGVLLEDLIGAGVTQTNCTSLWRSCRGAKLLPGGDDRGGTGRDAPGRDDPGRDPGGAGIKN
jgi:hypothetical protein